ncbi:MAG: hypothetical protein QNI91_08000 [Arenicellales bacterium]|nr:hypothetical protein [Arenicellales bacterium]
MFESIHAFVQANGFFILVYVSLLTAISVAVNNLATHLAKWKLYREDLELLSTE